MIVAEVREFGHNGREGGRTRGQLQAAGVLMRRRRGIVCFFLGHDWFAWINPALGRYGRSCWRCPLEESRNRPLGRWKPGAAP